MKHERYQLHLNPGQSLKDIEQIIEPIKSYMWASEVEVKQDDVITDLVITYKNNFRNERKFYYIEVENESTGDIIEKIRKYESLIWQLKAEGSPVGQLVIVYKKQSVKNKIDSKTFEIPIKTIHIAELSQKWEW